MAACHIAGIIVPPTRDEETGQFTQEYDEELFLEAVDELEMPTTEDIAASVGCSYDLAYRRLTALAEAGSVTKVVRGGTFIWLSASA